MHSVEVRVGDGDIASRMSNMRIWLDGRRCEPMVFRYDHVADAVVIQVEFAAEAEAAAFAEEFGGTVGSRP